MKLKAYIAIFSYTYKLYCKQYPFLLGSNIAEKIMPEKALKVVIAKTEQYTLRII